MVGKRTFVGFGFGPIQSGLFVYEAWRTGRFTSFCIAEVDDRMVSAINGNCGRYAVNIAHPDRIEHCEVSGVLLFNPRVQADRAVLVQAVRDADELATALPRVDFYEGDSSTAAEILAEALAPGSSRPQVLYAAENNNHAAEILDGVLRKRLPPKALTRFQTVNTVIGKMSGVITEAREIERLGLVPMAPGIDKAILVEAFNRILIGRISLGAFERGITVFQEKPDLLPFEEAKLYGHNAIHALIGYLAHERGLRTMAEVSGHPDLMNIARRAFLEESGQALCRKYAQLGDPLFTSAGFTDYADDLLRRMVNPYLNDLVERVIRDPGRKLGLADRFFGTMRLALEQGITPTLLARGAASAVKHLLGRVPASEVELRETLTNLWQMPVDSTAEKLIQLTWAALRVAKVTGYLSVEGPM